MSSPIIAVIARFTLLVVLLVGVLPSTVYAAADPIPPHPPSPLAGLPDDVFNGQVVTLSDGDRYEVTHAARGQTIRGRRWDAATAMWGPTRVLFKDPDLRCWGIFARGSGTGVSVRAECDRFFPVIDGQGEGRPFAIVSADTVTWQSFKLPGYAWWEPGISPDGTHAVWSGDEDYVTWNPETGFIQYPTAPPPDADGETPTITDDGTVTMAYSTDSCTATFDTYSAQGTPTRQVLDTMDTCEFGRGGITSIDAHTVAFGDNAEWAHARLTRADDTSPWTLAARAPLDAPGLLENVFHPTLGSPLIDIDGRPLAMVGNGSGELRVQLYDPTTQSWRPPTTLATRSSGTRCEFSDNPTSGLGLYAVMAKCAGPDLLVRSSDGSNWTTMRVRTQAMGANYALGLGAVASRRQTVILGKESSQTLPLGTAGRCDVVFPIAADRVLRLTATKGSRGWPDLLQRSTPRGWRTMHRVLMPTEGRCRRAHAGGLGQPEHFQIEGGGSARIRFREVDGRWDVRIR